MVTGEQKDDMKAEEVQGRQSFLREQTATYHLQSSSHDAVLYDLIGKITEGTRLM
ncbi:MAG: hypothetical protein ACI4SG_08265 [Oligosphaeraceae bacterium]